MFEFFDLDAEEDQGSVGGWVLDQIGKIPDVGDTFDYENLHVTVTETDNQRVVAINVIVEPEEDEEAEEKEEE